MRKKVLLSLLAASPAALTSYANVDFSSQLTPESPSTSDWLANLSVGESASFTNGIYSYPVTATEVTRTIDGLPIGSYTIKFTSLDNCDVYVGDEKVIDGSKSVLSGTFKLEKAGAIVVKIAKREDLKSFSFGGGGLTLDFDFTTANSKLKAYFDANLPEITAANREAADDNVAAKADAYNELRSELATRIAAVQEGDGAQKVYENESLWNYSVDKDGALNGTDAIFTDLQKAVAMLTVDKQKLDDLIKADNTAYANEQSNQAIYDGLIATYNAQKTALTQLEKDIDATVKDNGDSLVKDYCADARAAADAVVNDTAEKADIDAAWAAFKATDDYSGKAGAFQYNYDKETSQNVVKSVALVAALQSVFAEANTNYAAYQNWVTAKTSLDAAYKVAQQQIDAAYTDAAYVDLKVADQEKITAIYKAAIADVGITEGVIKGAAAADAVEGDASASKSANVFGQAETDLKAVVTAAQAAAGNYTAAYEAQVADIADLQAALDAQTKLITDGLSFTDANGNKVDAATALNTEAKAIQDKIDALTKAVDAAKTSADHSYDETEFAAAKAAIEEATTALASKISSASTNKTIYEANLADINDLTTKLGEIKKYVASYGELVDEDGDIVDTATAETKAAEYNKRVNLSSNFAASYASIETLISTLIANNKADYLAGTIVDIAAAAKDDEGKHLTNDKLATTDLDDTNLGYANVFNTIVDLRSTAITIVKDVKAIIDAETLWKTPYESFETLLGGTSKQLVLNNNGKWDTTGKFNSNNQPNLVSLSTYRATTDYDFTQKGELGYIQNEYKPILTQLSTLLNNAQANALENDKLYNSVLEIKALVDANSDFYARLAKERQNWLLLVTAYNWKNMENALTAGFQNPYITNNNAKLANYTTAQGYDELYSDWNNKVMGGTYDAETPLGFRPLVNQKLNALYDKALTLETTEEVKTTVTETDDGKEVTKEVTTQVTNYLGYDADYEAELAAYDQVIESFRKYAKEYSDRADVIIANKDNYDKLVKLNDGYDEIKGTTVTKHNGLINANPSSATSTFDSAEATARANVLKVYVSESDLGYIYYTKLIDDLVAAKNAYVQAVADEYAGIKLTAARESELEAEINGIINKLTTNFTEKAIQVNKDAYDTLFADGNATLAYINEQIAILDTYQLNSDQKAALEQLKLDQGAISTKVTNEYAAGTLDASDLIASDATTYAGQYLALREAAEAAVKAYTDNYDAQGEGSVYATNKAYLETIGWAKTVQDLIDYCNAAVNKYDAVGAALTNPGYSAYVAEQLYREGQYGFPNHDELYAYHTKIADLDAAVQKLLTESAPADYTKAYLFADAADDESTDFAKDLALAETYQTEMKALLGYFLGKADDWASDYYYQQADAVDALRTQLQNELTGAGILDRRVTQVGDLDTYETDTAIAADLEAADGSASINLDGKYAPALDEMLASADEIRNAAVVGQWKANYGTEVTEAPKTIEDATTYLEQLEFYCNAIDDECEFDTERATDSVKYKKIKAKDDAKAALTALNESALALENWAPTEDSKDTQLTLFKQYVEDAEQAIADLKAAYEDSKARSDANKVAQDRYDANVKTLAEYETAIEAVKAHISDVAVSDAVRASVDSLDTTLENAKTLNTKNKGSLNVDETNTTVDGAIAAVKSAIDAAYVAAYNAEAQAIIDGLETVEVYYNKVAAAENQAGVSDEQLTDYRTSIDGIRAEANDALAKALDSSKAADVKTATDGMADLKKLEEQLNDIHVALAKALGETTVVADALAAVTARAQELKDIIAAERAAIADSHLTDGNFKWAEGYEDWAGYFDNSKLNEQLTYNNALDKIAASIEAQETAAGTIDNEIITQAARYLYELDKIETELTTQNSTIDSQIASRATEYAYLEALVANDYKALVDQNAVLTARIAKCPVGGAALNTYYKDWLGRWYSSFDEYCADYVEYELAYAQYYYIAGWSLKNYSFDFYDFAGYISSAIDYVNIAELADRIGQAKTALGDASTALDAENIINRDAAYADYKAAKANYDNSTTPARVNQTATAEARKTDSRAKTVYFEGDLEANNQANVSGTNNDLVDEILVWADEVIAAAGDVNAVVEANTYTVGDTNNDKLVNLVDYTKVLGWILSADDEVPSISGKATDDERGHVAADLNGDQALDVADLSGVLKLALGRTSNSAAARRLAVLSPRQSDNNLISADFVEGENGGTRVAVYLANAATFTTGQFDIKLPAGMTINSESLTNRANGLEILTNEISNGYTRVVITSTDIHTIASGDGALVYFDVTGNGSSIVIDNAIFSDANAQRYEVQSANTSGIGSMIMDSIKSGAQRIYDASGRMMNRIQRGFNIIRNSDGTTTKQYNKGDK